MPFRNFVTRVMHAYASLTKDMVEDDECSFASCPDMDNCIGNLGLNLFIGTCCNLRNNYVNVVALQFRIASVQYLFITFNLLLINRKCVISKSLQVNKRLVSNTEECAYRSTYRQTN